MIRGRYNPINYTNLAGKIDHNSLLNVHQNVITTASPTFVGLTLSGLTGPAGLYINSDELITTTPPTTGTLGYWSKTGTVLSPSPAITVLGGMVGITGTGALSLYTTGKTGQLYLDTNGSVGINTATPSSVYKLDVAGGIRGYNASATGVYGQSDGNDGVFGISISGVGVNAQSSSYYGLYAHSASDYSIYCDGTMYSAGAVTFASTLGVTGSIQGLSLDLGIAGTSTGVLTLDGATSGYVKIQPLNAAGSYTLTLPPDDGDANQFLQTNGSGVLDWATVDLSGYLTGSLTATRIPYASGASALTDSANLTFDGTNLTCGGQNTSTKFIATTASGDALYNNAGNNDINIWRIDSSGGYGFYKKYIGSGSGNNNSLQLWTQGQAGADVQVYDITQDGAISWKTKHSPIGIGTAPNSSYALILQHDNGFGATEFRINNAAGTHIWNFAVGSTGNFAFTKIGAAKWMEMTPTGEVDLLGTLVVTGLSTLTGGAVIGTAASDPQDATPANRPAGVVAQLMYYSGKLYFCTNAATPTWEMITSA